MKKIKFSLDADNISRAIQELYEYRQEVQKKCKLVVQRLTDLGCDIAKAKVVDLGAIYSGNLVSSISGYYSPTLSTGFVRVDADYGMFVEFGTGTKGKVSSHPSGEYLAEANYSYMGGTTYVTLRDGRVGWFFPSDDGAWKFTEGQASRPFLWETARELENRFAEVAREVFAE